MSQQEPGPDYEQCRSDTQEWYNKKMLPALQEVLRKRGDSRYTALNEWHEALVDSIASCKENYERKLDDLKYEILQKEQAHPLYARCERLHESLSRSYATWRVYKEKVKELCSAEEFETIRQEAEEIWSALDLIRRLRSDLKDAVKALKPENPHKSPLGPED
jgi:hypothetical protein